MSAPDPSAIEEARQSLPAQLFQSLSLWAGQGGKIAPKAERDRKHQICLACPHWSEQGNAGMGRCALCGCTRFKHWLEGIHCPDKPPRW